MDNQTRYGWRAGALATFLLLGACSSGGDSGDAANGDEPRDDNPFAPAPVGSGDGASPPTNDGSLLSWSACGGALECATLPVPIDYSDPDSNRIDIALIRIPADSATRTGSLMLNPGGPGGSGVSLVRSFARARLIPDSVRQRYDIVGFDPRGVGLSGGIRCGVERLNEIDSYPVDRAEIESVFNTFSAFAADCVEEFGSYLQFLGSNNVVRDMDQIRLAMGDTTLNFLGYSYGTRLAALYLQAFPESSGRHILDGSMPPLPEFVPLVRAGLAPAQTNISNMLALCVAIDATCNPDQLAATLQQRVDQVEQTGGEGNEAVLLGAVLQFNSLDPTVSAPVISALYPYLVNNDIEPLRRLINLVEPSGNDGLSVASNVAVMCADDPARPTVDSLELLLQDFNNRSDLFAERYVTQLSICAGWPAAIDPIPAIATGQAPASIVIGGPTDAQTPLIFAEQMASAVGGQFLRSEHLGHTVSFQNKSICVDSNLVNYLLDGSLPTTDVCGRDSPPAAGILRSRPDTITIEPLPPIPLQYDPLRKTLDRYSMLR